MPLSLDGTGSITGIVTVSVSDDLGHVADTNTKISFPANDTISFETSGSERLRITPDGKVGIGTDNPLHDLEVYKVGTAVTATSVVRGEKAVFAIMGDATNTGASETDARLVFSSDGDISPSKILTSPLTAHGFEIALINEEPGAGLRFHDGTANAERFRIKSNGNVGIGSEIPSQKLDVNGVVAATSFAPTAVTAQLSHRNILHNGEFKVIQRYGTSFTINSTSDSEFYIDRYYTPNHDNLGDYTISQEADAPAGFRTSAKIQCTSTITSTSGTIQSFIQQIVEAQNVSHIFNGSGSQPMTLSFYYKSNTTDQRLVWFYTPDTTRHYSALFTPSATNTWERITISIPADTANTINDDNGAGLYVRFMIDAGDTYTGGRPTSWSASSNDRYNGHTNLCTNTANNFYITGLQLEMGSVATPYEHRTMSEELINCQRYYYPYKSILKGASSGGNRPWIPMQLFLNSASDNDVFVVVAGLNEQRAKMRTGSAEVRILAPLNSAPVTSLPNAGEWAYFYRGQGSGYYSGGGAFSWNDGYYNMYGCRSVANPRPTQIMIETNSEVGKVYIELDDEI